MKKKANPNQKQDQVNQKLKQQETIEKTISAYRGTKKLSKIENGSKNVDNEKLNVEVFYY